MSSPLFIEQLHYGRFSGFGLHQGRQSCPFKAVSRYAKGYSFSTASSDIYETDFNLARVEALLASFPRLTNTGSQHTTVETENVRYVYQPLEELYMVLITNRQSNILQDISTLHLFAQIVTSTCRNCNEAEIIRNAFELIGAFDEVCCLGYRENLSLPQIKNFLEMDSHEEKIQEIIEKNKELEANEERKRRAKQLEQQRKELARRGGPQQGSGSMNSGSYHSVPSPSRSTYAETAPQPAFESKLSKARSVPRGKGMMLGKKSKQADLFEAVRGEASAAPLLNSSAPAEEEEEEDNESM